MRRVGMMMKSVVREKGICYVAGSENGGKDQEPKCAGSL